MKEGLEGMERGSYWMDAMMVNGDECKGEPRFRPSRANRNNSCMTKKWVQLNFSEYGKK